MKRLLSVGAALAALFVVIDTAPAQVQIQTKRIQAKKAQVQAQPADAAPLRVAGPTNDNKLALLQIKGVQEDMKLTEEQIKSVNKLAEDFTNALKSLKPAEAFQKSRQLIEQNQLVLAKMLSADQNQRLGQLEVQQKGPQAFFDQQVSKEINLTNEQRTQVSEVIRNSNTKRTEIVRDAKGDQQKIQEKLAELNKEIVNDIVKNLTDGQKGTWKVLVGEPFKYTLPAVGAAIGTRPGIGVINPPVKILPIKKD